MERTALKRVPVGSESWVTVDVYGDPDASGLLIVPGVMSDARNWQSVVPALTAWPSVFIVNRRGRAPAGPLTEQYTIRSEVDDLNAVLDDIGEPRDLFGWSYGGLITLLLATERPVRHLIAYEPVAPPFGEDALPSLQSAASEGDFDRTVEIVNRDISGFSAEHVDALRADPRGWERLCTLSKPLHAELSALAATQLPEALGSQAEAIDLVIGENNIGTAPYGTSFEDVCARTPGAQIHSLYGQGHLAHVADPAALGRLVTELAARKASN